MKNIFESARLKLTAYYLLIIIFFTSIISLFVYIRTCNELEKGFWRARVQARAEQLGIHLPRHLTLQEELPPRLKELVECKSCTEELIAAKKRLRINLLLINSIVLGLSAVGGYTLAGLTLEPIQKAMQKQKRFVADASHELRTPLTALKTSIEVALNDKKILKKNIKLLRSNLEEVDHLQKLTDDLLKLANYENNGSAFNFEYFNIAKVAKKAIEKIGPVAKKKKIKLKVDIEDIKVNADPDKIEEMLLIFLDNAVKYTEDKGKIKFCLKEHDKKIEIKIRDTGIGIPKDEIPKLFNRFYRADNSRSKKEVNGFGLGLALAKKIINVHKGKVEVESELDKGTTFTIILPIKK